MADSTTRLMSNVAETLAGMGISPGAIKETLEAREVSQQEFDAATNWLKLHQRDAEWSKRVLAGDADASRDLLLANIILSSQIKAA
jgi:hypothetical protein